MRVAGSSCLQQWTAVQSRLAWMFWDILVDQHKAPRWRCARTSYVLKQTHVLAVNGFKFLIG